MITKEQAIKLGEPFSGNTTLHYVGITGKAGCSIETGPRGGIKEHVTRVRVSGKCQTWKTRPEEFRLPIKYGLRESWQIDAINAYQFHLPEDCPAGIHF